MTVAERIRISKLLETMEQHKEMAESIGLRNASKFININKTQPQKKGGEKNEICSR